MTLGDFFTWIGDHPLEMSTYYVGLPIVAILLWFISKDEGHLKPWNYIYSILVYASCIPGIVAVSLSIYFFLFERQSLLNAELFVQIVPVISMLATLFFIKRNVEFCDIPGFDKISGFMILIFAVTSFMWILDKTHIIAISIIPFYVVILLFIGLILLVRFGMKSFLS